MNKRDFRVLGIFALLVVFVFILSISFASALSITSNVTNGTYWMKGGRNMTAAFNFNFTGLALSSNVTNFTIINTNFTYYTATTNFSGWSCNCSVAQVFCNGTDYRGGNASLTSFYLNLTYTTPSTATEINHTLIINATTNETVVIAHNWTTWLLAVDGVAPTVTLPLYTNATTKNANSSILILNVSVSDSGSGLTGSVCIIDVNGTNQTIAVSNGWCNLSSGNLNGLPNGNRTMSIYANDSVLNWKLNNSLAIFTDSTVPTATASCSPTTIETEDAFPCSCSGSDALTGVNSSLTSRSSTSPEGILTPTSSGVFIYTCGITDNAGNSASHTFTYIVDQKAGAGSSGSTSAATVTAPTHTFSTIVPGTPATKEYADSLGMGVKEIRIEVNSEAKSVKIAVTKYDGKPAAVSVEKSGNVYQYLQIKVDNVEGKLSKATVTTKVEKSWITENSLDKDDLALFKFDEVAGEWGELSTIYSSEDDTYYYYTSEVTSFSYFAIGSKSLVGGEEGAETTGGEEAITKNLTWLWIVITAVVLIAIAVVVMMKKKK